MSAHRLAPVTRLVPRLDEVDFRGLFLPMLCIYDHPKDFPDKVVMRVWDAPRGPTNIALLFDSIEEARRAVPAWFIRMPRVCNDDPVIVESYI